jgi:hypothetical protein
LDGVGFLQDCTIEKATVGIIYTNSNLVIFSSDYQYSNLGKIKCKHQRENGNGFFLEHANGIPYFYRREATIYKNCQTDCKQSG